MKQFLFLDLDDTVFQTKRKCPPGARLTTAAVNREGEPNSFFTHKQKAMVEWFFREKSVIPTTARDSNALSRVALDFNNRIVINFGAVILDQKGTLDPEWDAHFRPQAMAYQQILVTILERSLAYAEHHIPGCRMRLISDYAMPLYLVAKHETADNAALRQLKEECFDPYGKEYGGLKTHLNDNNLALLPTFLDKGHAVEYLIEKLTEEHGEILTWGMGDSLSDAGFLSRCDYAILPQRSQIAHATVHSIVNATATL